MEDTERLWLCLRCKNKLMARGATVLEVITIDNAEQDCECDICGEVSNLLHDCIVAWEN